METLLKFFLFLILLLWPSIARPQPYSRIIPDWLLRGVIYEIYPRAFSKEGNFNAITARLDELKNLGVSILWLMPIHPIGQEKKKGTIGSRRSEATGSRSAYAPHAGDHRHRCEPYFVG
jgi:hypothetical protein